MEIIITETEYENLLEQKEFLAIMKRNNISETWSEYENSEYQLEKYKEQRLKLKNTIALWAYQLVDIVKANTKPVEKDGEHILVVDEKAPELVASFLTSITSIIKNTTEEK